MHTDITEDEYGKWGPFEDATAKVFEKAVDDLLEGKDIDIDAIVESIDDPDDMFRERLRFDLENERR